MLDDSVLDVWKVGDILTPWFHSEVVVKYQKVDPERPDNYRPIAITNSIYRVIMKLHPVGLQRLLDHVAIPEQYGSRPQRIATEQACNLISTQHEVSKEGHEPYVVLLDVGKGVPLHPARSHR